MQFLSLLSFVLAIQPLEESFQRLASLSGSEHGVVEVVYSKFQELAAHEARFRKDGR